MGSIYVIVNLRKLCAYIGSTERPVDYRWRRHRSDLRAGTHHNIFLQRAWRKYGRETFEFDVVQESIKPENLISAEQLHMDRMKEAGWTLYNTNPFANNCKGRKASVETRKRLSESHTGLKQTKRSRLKRAKTWCNRHGKITTFQSPDGRRHIVKNMREFARKRGLCGLCLALLARGKLHRHKGWTVAGSTHRVYSLRSPSGDEFKRITQLKLFCAHHKLPYKQVHKLFTGGRRQVVGWRILD